MLEVALLGNALEGIMQSLSPVAVALLDPGKLYGLLTILELLDLLDTPLPTLGDEEGPLAALRQWITGAPAAAQRRDTNKEVRENLAHQAAESLIESEKTKADILQEYKADPTPENKARLDAAQENENRIRGEAKKQADIAKGWKYKFRYENGRWPKNYEVLAAKIRGDYYD